MNALGFYHAVVIFGGPGSGKTTLGKAIADLLRRKFSEKQVMHAAHSAPVAENTGADTLAFALHSGQYTRGAAEPYREGAAEKVAAVTHAVFEEVPAWGPCIIKEVFEQRHAAIRQLNANDPRLQEPFAGLRGVFTGDEMQRLDKGSGIAYIDSQGRPQPMRQAANLSLWDVEEMRAHGPKILYLVMHGNHRLDGKLLRMYQSGCGP